MYFWKFPHRKEITLVVLVTQSCPTFCDPMVCILPGSSVPGILQARILNWVAVPFSRGSSQPMDQTQVFHITGRFFTIWATGDFLRHLLLPVPSLCTVWDFTSLPSLILPHLADWTSYPISFLMQCSSPGLSPSEHKLIQKPTESSVSNRSFKNYWKRWVFSRKENPTLTAEKNNFSY